MAKDMKVSLTLTAFVSYMSKWYPTKHAFKTHPFWYSYNGLQIRFGACPLLILLKTKGMLFCYHWQYFRQIWKVAKCYEIACEVWFRKKPVGGIPSLVRMGATVRWKRKLCVDVDAHNKQMAGILNTRPTASVALALVLTSRLWEKYFQICSLDLFIWAGLTGNQKCCKIQ